MKGTVYPGFEAIKEHYKGGFLNRPIPLFDGETGEQIDNHYTLVSETDNELIIGSDISLLQVIIDENLTKEIQDSTLKNQIIAKCISKGYIGVYNYYFEYKSKPCMASFGKNRHFLNVYLSEIGADKGKSFENAPALKEEVIPFVEKIIDFLIQKDEEIKDYYDKGELEIIRRY